MNFDMFLSEHADLLSTLCILVLLQCFKRLNVYQYVFFYVYSFCTISLTEVHKTVTMLNISFSTSNIGCK